MPPKPPSALQLIGIGSTIAGLVAGGLVLGWLIDRQVNTFPTFALVGLVVGMMAAGHHLYSMFRKFTKQ